MKWKQHKNFKNFCVILSLH